MTLIVTALAEDTVWQVSDRRLTKAGNLYDDAAVKKILVRCSDGIFVMGYTGMALTRGDCGDRIDEWAVRKISELPLETTTVPKVLESFRADLTKLVGELRRIPPNDRRIEWAVAGFGPPGPFAASLTNHEHINGHPLDAVSDEFQFFMRLRNGRPMRRLDLIFVGAEAAIRGEVRASVQKVRSKLYLRPPRQVLNGLVQIVRRAAAEAIYGHFISRHCMGTFIERAGRVCCLDYPATGSRVVSAPHQISSGLSSLGVTIESPTSNTFIFKGRFKFGSR